MTDIFSKIVGRIVAGRSRVGQSRVPYLPPEKLREMRDTRLRELVRYAARTVPYYRRLFRAQGIDPAAIRVAEDLDRLPLLEKEAVRQEPRLFVSESRRGQTAVPFVTSGTTGSPLTVFCDRDYLLSQAGFNKRENDVIRNLLGNTESLRKLILNYEGSNSTTLRRFLQRYRFRPALSEPPRAWVDDPVEHVIDALNDYRPDVLGSYGSYLEALFRMVAARDMDVHMPRAVLYFTDAMTDGGKRLFEDTLGIPVLSHYNAAEAFKIGFTCEERTGFHLHEDLTYVKIVDSSGRRLPPDEKGEVVISNLVNRGTVLLNYRLGDIAALSHEPCPCGRTFVMLADLEGRVEDILHLPDGSFVHPRLVWKLFKHRAGVLRYQLIQHALDTFELRLTTIDRSAFDRVIGEVIADLRQLLGQDAIIDAVYQAEFQPYTGAKFRPVLSLLEERD